MASGCKFKVSDVTHKMQNQLGMLIPKMPDDHFRGVIKMVTHHVFGCLNDKEVSYA
jgi:hypothetical protein